jgi:hypothetical protein
MGQQVFVLRKTRNVIDLLVNGVVAQLVERLVRNEKVAGSNPVGSTSFAGIFNLDCDWSAHLNTDELIVKPVDQAAIGKVYRRV